MGSVLEWEDDMDSLTEYFNITEYWIDSCHQIMECLFIENIIPIYAEKISVDEECLFMMSIIR